MANFIKEHSRLMLAALAVLVFFALFPPVFNGNQSAASAGIINDHYTNGQVKLLIVPGHDNDPSSGGTSFGPLIEAKLNLALSQNILRFFGSDPHFQPLITRDEAGYKEPFSSYFTDHRDEIIAFRDSSRANMRDLISSGAISAIISPAKDAAPEASIKLNGINKWINENNVDISLHVHFNDYAGRRSGVRGRYSGFVVFIPERQMPNYSASVGIGTSLFKKLVKFFPTSNQLTENRGLVEDQELIALGGGRTLNANTASILIEYGYIYESAWLNASTREMILKEIAYQTYLGIKNYFEPQAVPAPNPLEGPYFWNRQMMINPAESRDVLALQIALTKDGLYPPPGFYRNDCPMSGIFGRCTRRAIQNFQTKYGIYRSGYVDFTTLSKINQVYSYSIPELF